jgi:hypothetical protein
MRRAFRAYIWGFQNCFDIDTNLPISLTHEAQRWAGKLPMTFKGTDDVQAACCPARPLQRVLGGASTSAPSGLIEPILPD